MTSELITNGTLDLSVVLADVLNLEGLKTEKKNTLQNSLPTKARRKRKEKRRKTRMSNKIIKQWSMVRPAEETPRKSLWLSSLDLTIRGPHTCAFYVYHPENSSMNTHNFFDATILKESLSRALVPFYPMAGRLKEANHSGRLEIECNGEGALFVEAETMHSLVDFGDFRPTPELMRLVIPTCDYSRGHALIPLLMVQLTRFSCGGVTLGFAQHHRVADGHGHLHFINSWARLARGLDLQVAPIHERTPHLLPRNPPQVMFQHFEHDPPKRSPGDDIVSSVNPENETTITSFFKITNDQINALKQEATSSEMNHNEHCKLSTYEVLAAHILRAACRARGLDDDQEVKLYTPVDGRHRLKSPALPQGFCGNAIFLAAYIAKSGHITRNSLGYVAGEIQETLKTMTGEDYLRSAIDYLETQPDLTSLVRGAHTFKCPNLLVNSWLKFPFYEADFGWGKPLLAGRGGGTFDGLSYLVPSPNRDDGVHLMISLLDQHMILFEKYLYDF